MSQPPTAPLPRGAPTPPPGGGSQALGLDNSRPVLPSGVLRAAPLPTVSSFPSASFPAAATTATSSQGESPAIPSSSTSAAAVSSATPPLSDAAGGATSATAMPPAAAVSSTSSTSSGPTTNSNTNGGSSSVIMSTLPNHPAAPQALPPEAVAAATATWQLVQQALLSGASVLPQAGGLAHSPSTSAASTADLLSSALGLAATSPSAPATATLNPLATALLSGMVPAAFSAVVPGAAPRPPVVVPPPAAATVQPVHPGALLAPSSGAVTPVVALPPPPPPPTTPSSLPLAAVPSAASLPSANPASVSVASTADVAPASTGPPAPPTFEGPPGPGPEVPINPLHIHPQPQHHHQHHSHHPPHDDGAALATNDSPSERKRRASHLGAAVDGIYIASSKAARVAASEASVPSSPVHPVVVRGTDSVASSVAAVHAMSNAAEPSLSSSSRGASASAAASSSVFDVPPPQPKTEAELARMTPSERRRYERNWREQQRSYRISQQIKELRDVLADSNVPYKPNKFSILISVTEYIKQLQSRAIMLDAEHQKLVATLGQAGAVLSTPEGTGGIGIGASGAATPPSSSSDDSEREGGAASVGHHRDPDLLLVQGIDYKGIFGSCPFAIGVASLDGRVLACNEALEALFGCEPREMVEQSLFLFIRNHQEIFEAMADLLKRSSLAAETGELVPPEPSGHLLYWCGTIVSQSAQKLHFTITLTTTPDSNPKYFSFSAASAS